ncbi:unnamed protein product [Schistosoma turkestanicum]|nr:unnamed protein product [Schistosoma turkestanicum]
MIQSTTRRLVLKRFDIWVSFKQCSTYQSPGSKDSSGDKFQQSSWSGKNAWKIGLVTLSCSGLFGFGFALAAWGPPKKDDNGVEIGDKFSQMPIVWGYIRRTLNSVLEFNQSIKDPVSEKLLPDPVQPPYYQPPYTLVLEMTNVLVHPEWKFRTGWRFKKRPALELFLQQLSPHYEVVVYTNESIMTGAPVLGQMDPQGQFIHFRLFREATRYKGGKHIKDLSCLNRDLSRVVFVDWDSAAAQLQPRNSLIIKRWDGEESDRELIDLAAFLRMIAMGSVDDVRLVLDYYREFDDPLAFFREKHEELMEVQAKRKHETEKALLKRPRPTFSFTGMARS